MLTVIVFYYCESSVLAPRCGLIATAPQAHVRAVSTRWRSVERLFYCKCTLLLLP
jgi:hypothetical protein